MRTLPKAEQKPSLSLYFVSAFPKSRLAAFPGAVNAARVLQSLPPPSGLPQLPMTSPRSLSSPCHPEPLEKAGWDLPAHPMTPMCLQGCADSTCPPAAPMPQHHAQTQLVWGCSWFSIKVHSIPPHLITMKRCCTLYP